MSEEMQKIYDALSQMLNIFCSPVERLKYRDDEYKMETELQARRALIDWDQNRWNRAVRDSIDLGEEESQSASEPYSLYQYCVSDPPQCPRCNSHSVTQTRAADYRYPCAGSPAAYRCLSCGASFYFDDGYTG